MSLNPLTEVGLSPAVNTFENPPLDTRFQAAMSMRLKQFLRMMRKAAIGLLLFVLKIQYYSVLAVLLLASVICSAVMLIIGGITFLIWRKKPAYLCSEGTNNVPRVPRFYNN